MIKNLFMSIGSILGCMIMMVSFAASPNDECIDAREDAKVCKDVIKNCEGLSSDNLWVCDPPISQNDASVCLSACMEVSKKICKEKAPDSADVVMCDDCIDFIENNASNVSEPDNPFGLMLFDEYGNGLTIIIKICIFC